MSEAVARRRLTGALDRYNNAANEWGDPVALPGLWLFAPGRSGEKAAADGVTVTTSPTLYAVGHWPDVTAADRLVVRGVEWVLDGAPAEWRHLRGDVAGAVITLRSVTEEV